MPSIVEAFSQYQQSKVLELSNPEGLSFDVQRSFYAFAQLLGMAAAQVKTAGALPQELRLSLGQATRFFSRDLLQFKRDYEAELVALYYHRAEYDQHQACLLTMFRALMYLVNANDIAKGTRVNNAAARLTQERMLQNARTSGTVQVMEAFLDNLRRLEVSLQSESEFDLAVLLAMAETLEIFSPVVLFSPELVRKLLQQAHQR